jgi:hypothetical protein
MGSHEFKGLVQIISKSMECMWRNTMISVAKQDNKLIGIYQTFLPTEEVICILPYTLKDYILNKLYQELDEQDESGLFTYNILGGTNEQELFGLKCEIVFEFIPNKELIEELKIITERLQIGL